MAGGASATRTTCAWSGIGPGACLDDPPGTAGRAGQPASKASLQYAVSPEWGYLNTAITNLGTGLKASMMLHLPALSMSGLIKRAVKASAQLGLSIRGFFSESMESLGDMYLIANEITIGMTREGDHRQPGPHRGAARRVRERARGRS